MRSGKHSMWSARIHKIEKIRKVAGVLKYYVNNRWFFGYDLIPVPEKIVYLKPLNVQKKTVTSNSLPLEKKKAPRRSMRIKMRTK